LSPAGRQRVCAKRAAEFVSGLQKPLALREYPFAKRQWQVWMQALILRIARGAAVILGLGLLFAWLGVYETGALPFHKRTVYWATTMAVGTLTALLAVPFVRLRLMPGQPLALQLGVIAGLISIPVTACVMWFIGASGGTVGVDVVPTQFTYVYVISLIMTLGYFGVVRLGLVNWPGLDSFKAADPAPPPAAGFAGAPPAFRDRLPDKLKAADIYAVEAEDHYLRAHTSAGSDLILMRLADAIRELSAVEGLQTHRSWWVARAGVAEVVRASGKVMLKLRSGVDAPVSRTYAADVKAAGW
jgi:hypothetical protein